MICRGCGRNVDNDSRFCKYCGCSLINDSNEIIKIKIIDMNNISIKKIEIKKNSTYKELLNLMLDKNIIPPSIISFETVEIFDGSGHQKLRSNLVEDLKFDDTILSNYFVDGCTISLYYEGIYKKSCRIDIRDCLYGCPTSKNIELDLNSKEVDFL